MGRMTKEDWVVVALDVLSTKGVDALTLAKVCEVAGKTKGSFYHHFKDVGALREAMLSYWEEKHTLHIIEMAQQKATAKEKADVLNRLAAQADWGIERAMRLWAQQDDVALRAVRSVDRRRVAYLVGLYDGVAPARAKQLAWIEYSALLGAQQLFETFSLKERDVLGKVLREALLGYGQGV